MKGGYNANLVMQDYKREQLYKKKVERQVCKDRDCRTCKYQPICEAYEEEYTC